MKERINDLNMTLTDIIVALAEGNPGATTACVEMVKHQPVIDPQAFPMASLFGADSLGLYGSELYMLWNDVCGRDVGKVVGVLRAWQLGILTDTQIRDAVSSCRERTHDESTGGLDLDGMLASVSEQIPDFDVSARAQDPA